MFSARLPTPGGVLHNRASSHVRGIFTKQNHLHPRNPLVRRLDSAYAVDLGWGGRFVVLAYCGAFCWTDIEADDGDVELQCSDCQTARAADAADEHVTATAERGRRGGYLDLSEMSSPVRISVPVIRPKPGSLPRGHRSCVRRAALCPSKGNAS
ncbi:hypothetical protein H4W30_007636 [Amycolatopsis roodepoortensis]|uniref:Uncharacterized protein n=1 Tax=Amycolatopsis roodepoortensis TaxID=700274 RepID=A0ABR9LJU4_9PSEU|nr:hypothetical protein [Amycolatopsis roodepoortensis]